MLLRITTGFGLTVFVIEFEVPTQPKFEPMAWIVWLFVKLVLENVFVDERLPWGIPSIINWNKVLPFAVKVMFSPAQKILSISELVIDTEGNGVTVTDITWLVSIHPLVADPITKTEAFPLGRVGVKIVEFWGVPCEAPFMKSSYWFALAAVKTMFSPSQIELFGSFEKRDTDGEGKTVKLIFWLTIQVLDSPDTLTVWLLVKVEVENVFTLEGAPWETPSIKN